MAEHDEWVVRIRGVLDEVADLQRRQSAVLLELTQQITRLLDRENGRLTSELRSNVLDAGSPTRAVRRVKRFAALRLRPTTRHGAKRGGLAPMI
jgi:hypothetical protein